MADRTSQCDKISEISAGPKVTRRSPKSSITNPYSECHSNIKEDASFNDSLCDSEVYMDSESNTTTSSLASSEIATECDSQGDTIIDLGLDQKCGTSSTKCILNQHLYTDDSDTLVETSSKRSSKRVRMKASWNNTNFDLRSVLRAPPSPQAEKCTSKRELNLSPEANHKVNPLACASSLGESSSDQVISEGEIDFGSNSDDKVCQFGGDQVYFQSQYYHVKMNNFIYGSGFDLRSVISESSSSKPTSESVLDFDSKFVNHKENILKRKQADCRPPRNSKKNGYYYDYDFDLRSTLSESLSPKSTSESLLDFESVVANYKKNMLGRKQVDYRHERNPAKDGYQHDPDFDLRSTLSESSSPKPTSESKLDFESEVNYKENLLKSKQADCHPPRNPSKNGYSYDPDFDLRSTLSESPSPKPTSENKLEFESETSSKASINNQTNNRPRSVSVFDLRYVLDAKQSDMASEECDMSQQIIMQSKNKLIQMHRDAAVFSHSGFFRQRNKKTFKRRQQRHRSLCKKKYLKEVIIDDNFYPVKQELTDAEETPSTITEFLRRMRSESDKRKDSKSVVKAF